MILLNPGPVTLTERARRNPLQPDLCPCSSPALVLAAVESMPAALVPANGRLLNLENGVYGAGSGACGCWSMP